MRKLQLLAMALGAAIAAVGLVGVAAPSVLLELGRSLQTPTALYFVAVVRVLFGVLLLFVAAVSRAPTTLRVLGALIVIAGLLTPLFGVERAQAMLKWWSEQGGQFMRGWAAVAVVFGVFIIYVVRPRPRSAA